MLAASQIFACPDVRSFLGLTLTTLKERKGWGLRELASFSGFRSPSAVSMILKGQRNLSVESARRLTESLHLEKSSATYVLALARLGNTRQAKERVRMEEELVELRTRRASNALELSQYRFLTVWYYPALYALATPGNLYLDPENIARRLGRNVTASMVKIAVGDLINLKLLRLHEGILSQISGPVSTRTQGMHVAIRRYHREMLKLATEAVDLPVEERELNGLTVMVPKEKMAAIRSRLREFREELSQMLAGAQSGEVHQISIQLFPLTRIGDEK